MSNPFHVWDTLGPAKTLGDALARAERDQVAHETLIATEIHALLTRAYRETGWSKAHIRRLVRDAARTWGPK
jgi:hypothetical protein